MNYTPTEWNSGDIVSAEKLNKIEEGVADVSNNQLNLEIITFTKDQNNNFTCSKTNEEIGVLLDEGKAVLVQYKFLYNGVLYDTILCPLLLQEGAISFSYISDGNYLNLYTTRISSTSTWSHYTYHLNTN